jgi:hypothetical protein
MTSQVSAASALKMQADSVADKIGYTLSHESFQSKANIVIKTSSIKNELQKHSIETGFKVKTIILHNYVLIDKQLHIKGTIMYADKINRLIQTQFDTNCTVKNRETIIVDTIEFKTFAKPRAESFIVPANAINLGALKRLSFPEAIEQVSAVAKRVAEFNIPMDLEPKKYVFISFMMNKLNESDKIISIMSELPYSNDGKNGRLLKTNDGWLVAFIETKFAYNNLQPQFFNLFWKTNKNLIPIDSYSTHGMVKEMQIVLSNKGYDVGRLDGLLNTQTKTAIQQYIKKYKFHPKSQISTALLWFIHQNIDFDIPKIVQAALLQHGHKIGAIDGVIGHNTIKAVKQYQKALNLKQNGRITPGLVYIMLYGAKNINNKDTVTKFTSKPVYLKTYQNKKWPNQI